MKYMALAGTLISCSMGYVHTRKPDAKTVRHAAAYRCPKKTGELKAAMRKLWEDHVTYTRNFIISQLAGLGDIDAVAKRLLSNQDDIGNAIKPFYGAPAGDALAKLLRDHILIAVDVVKAAQVGAKLELEKHQKAWHANADDIANFLAGANPHWNKATLSKMLHMHLDMTTDEVVARLQKNWPADVQAYDKGHVHMLHFSDVLIDGIAQQFPDKFECLCPKPHHSTK